MAWTLVEETFSRTYSDGSGGQSAKRTFKVWSDADVANLDDVLAADDGTTAIPSVGDSFPDQTALRVTKRNPRQIEDEKRIFDVAVVYKTGGGAGGGARRSRYDEAVEWSRKWGKSREVETVIEKTVSETTTAVASWDGTGPTPDEGFAAGRAILNSAGDPFDPPLTVKRRIATLSLGIVVDSLTDIDASFTSIKAIKALEGKSNSDSVTIADYAANPAEVRIVSVTVDGVREADTNRLRVGFDMEFDPWLHIPVVLDAGFNELDVDDNPIAIRRGGKPTTDPARLNGSGVAESSTGPDYLFAFGVHLAAAFSGLGFPTDM